MAQGPAAMVRSVGCSAGAWNDRQVRKAKRSPSGAGKFTRCAGPDASAPEKVYFVIRGELTVIVDGKETVLKANDSCVIEPNETREIINRGNEVCSIVVAVAMPPK